MGCCVSTNQGSSNSTLPKRESLKLPKSTHESRAPPPSVEEETVKEVLSVSETPKPKQQPLPTTDAVINSPQEQHHIHLRHEGSNKRIHVEPPFADEKIKEKGGEEEEEEEGAYEEVLSELCSLSFSESVSTTTINNDKRDDHDEEEVIKQKVVRSPASKFPPRNRAFSGDFGTKRDRVLGMSPTRRSDQSPVKRNNVGVGGGTVKLVQSREWGTGQMGKRATRSDQNRRDQGEGSGRRSRSPANNRSRVGRSPAARRTSGSPGRVIRDQQEGMKTGTGMENKWASSSCSNGAHVQNEESLENPLVSLECFIFL